MCRDCFFHFPRKIAAARSLKGVEHSGMPAEKIHLNNILVPDVGQNFAVKYVSSVRFRSDNAPYKIRAILPGPWHTKDHFAIHRSILAEDHPVRSKEFDPCRFHTSAGFTIPYSSTVRYLPSLITSSWSNPSRFIPTFSITRPEETLPTKCLAETL